LANELAYTCAIRREKPSFAPFGTSPVTSPLPVGFNYASLSTQSALLSVNQLPLHQLPLNQRLVTQPKDKS
jgi:hypothetical protein